MRLSLIFSSLTVSLCFGRLEKDYMLLGTLLTMKPLHRPVHDMFIFDKTWQKMSAAEREKANAEGKIRIPSRAEVKKLTPAEWSELRAKFRPYVDEIRTNIVKTLKSLPRTLILALRYILENTNRHRPFKTKPDRVSNSVYLDEEKKKPISLNFPHFSNLLQSIRNRL